jgi:hypothetical protein
MSTAAAVPPDVAAYVATVRSALRDLPESERDDLLTEVEASLAEAAHEGGSLSARLGPPEEFAAELRAAAGLHQPAGPPTPEVRVARQLRDLAARVAGHPASAALRRVAYELAPIWWVARAYFAVGAVAYLLDAQWSLRFPVVPQLGSTEAGLAIIVIAMVASVWLGLQLRRHGNPFPRTTLLANALLALAIVPVAVEVDNARMAASQFVSVPSVAAPEGIAYYGQPVTNIYPFTRDGKLLHDVLLYAQDGQPLDVPGNRGLDPDRRFVTTNGNRALFNVFPIRYYEPGTRRVARPNAAPYIEHPFVVTPPLTKAGG